ncbi:phage tail tape measure protein [Streptomyces sp. NPDC048566]|uniref:phage tail tape measure protein n=1 Tax=Streptomyces sp. NPDC048566 TaxID=3365569 RepID=UPI00370F8038
MALTLGELSMVLRLDDAQFNSRVQGARNTIQQVGGAMDTTGQKLTKNVSLPLIGVGATALKMAGDFESGMNGVRAVTGATGDDFTKMREQAKQLGATTQFSATEAANAMEFLGMAGFKTKDIMSSLPDVLNLAAAGNTDLASTADIASNIMSGFGVKATESARVADVLAQTMRSANVDLSMLGESFKYVAPTAKAAGWSFEQTAAAIGFLGNAGIQGSSAGTGLNNMLATLASSSSAGGKKLKAFGVAAMGANGKVRPLTDILQDLVDKGADISDVMGIFGLEAGPKLQALMGQGSKGLQKFTDELKNSKGAAKEMADTRMEGLNGSLKGLQSAFEGLMIAIGDSGLLEFATKFAEKLTGLTQSLGKTNPAMLRVGVIVGAVAAAVGPLLIIVGKMISMFGSAFAAIAKFGRGAAKFIRWFGRMAAAVGRFLIRLAMAVGRIVLAGVRIGASMARAALSYIAAWTRMAAAAVMSGIRIAAAATVSAARTAAVWAASAARMTATWLLAVVRVAATTIIQFGLMAARAVAWAATMAAQWLVAMGPIGWAILAVAALVALIVVYWDQIKAATIAVWDWIVAKIVWAKDMLVAAFMNFTLIGLLISHWSSIKSTAVSWWNSIVAWVKAIPGRLYTAFLNWTLLGLIIKHWSAIKTATVVKALEMIAFVRSIPGRIRSIFSGLGSILVAAGRNLIAGLIRGIVSKFGSVRSALHKLTAMIPKEKGPPAKDARLLTPAGRLIIAGFQDGIAAQVPALRRQLLGLTRQLPDMVGALNGTPALGSAMGSLMAAPGPAAATAGTSAGSGTASVPGTTTLRAGDAFGEQIIGLIRKQVGIGGGDVQVVLSGRR